MQYLFFRALLNESNLRTSHIVFKYWVLGQYEDWNGTFVKFLLPVVVWCSAAKSTPIASAVKTLLLSFNQTRAECGAEIVQVAQVRRFRGGFTATQCMVEVQGVDMPLSTLCQCGACRGFVSTLPDWKRNISSSSRVKCCSIKSPHPHAVFYCDSVLSRETHASILIFGPKSQCSFLLIWHCCPVLPCPSSSVA